MSYWDRWVGGWIKGEKVVWISCCMHEWVGGWVGGWFTLLTYSIWVWILVAL